MQGGSGMGRKKKEEVAKPDPIKPTANEPELYLTEAQIQDEARLKELQKQISAAQGITEWMNHPWTKALFNWLDAEMNAGYQKFLAAKTDDDLKKLQLEPQVLNKVKIWVNREIQKGKIAENAVKQLEDTEYELYKKHFPDVK